MATRDDIKPGDYDPQSTYDTSPTDQTLSDIGMTPDGRVTYSEPPATSAKEPELSIARQQQRRWWHFWG